MTLIPLMVRSRNPEAIPVYCEVVNEGPLPSEIKISDFGFTYRAIAEKFREFSGREPETRTIQSYLYLIRSSKNHAEPIEPGMVSFHELVIMLTMHGFVHIKLRSPEYSKKVFVEMKDSPSMRIALRKDLKDHGIDRRVMDVAGLNPAQYWQTLFTNKERHESNHY